MGRSDACDVALPGPEISRTHCFVDGDAAGWQVIDRSRHGITLDGASVKRAELHDGVRVGVGDFSVLFRDKQTVCPPTHEMATPRTQEQLLCTEASIQVSEARLVVVEGPQRSERHRLRKSRLTVGGSGSDIVLADRTLMHNHCRLQISRGRVMLEPGTGAVWLDGQRLINLTPLYPDESFRIGETWLRVEIGPSTITPISDRFGDMVGVSPAMKRVFGTLKVMAAHDDPVLIIGESGTGKELAAHGVHVHSRRSSGPFIPINCGAISAELFESELFGHEKGAFTGAARKKDGAFHLAHGGTLFLDELGELPLALQAKLLRVLGGGGVRRVGGYAVEHPDVRVIAATNRDVVSMVRAGTFRADLFFRLETLFVQLPPLRGRESDITTLAESLAKAHRADASISLEAMAVLCAHRWPGNIRELKNVLHRALILGGPRIDVGDLTFHRLDEDSPGHQPRGSDDELGFLRELLKRHGGNRSAVARELGMSRSGLLYRLRRHGLA